MISFLITAKNCEKFILECLNSILQEKTVKLEIILIIDEESNKLIDLVNEKIVDERLTIKKNIGVGKIIGLNYAYSLSKGAYIKCVDADDILSPSYFDQNKELLNHDAHLHAADIVDEKLKKLCKYYVNYNVLKSTYNYYLSQLLSVPKWCWTFNRSIANKLFPLPSDLPFEDVWMGLIIKKNAKSILYTNKPLYLYRQHGYQTFGGFLNYSSDIIKFRSCRMIRLIDIINRSECIFIDNKINKNITLGIKNYYYILFSKYSLAISNYTYLVCRQKLN